MKLHYFITCLFTLVLWNTIAQKVNYDDPKEQKRIAEGYIKSSVGIGYAYDKDGRKKPAGYKETMEMFDNKGVLNQFIVYENNEIKERWAFRYNKDGLKTDALCYNGKEELIEKYNIEYKGKNPVSKKGERNKKPYLITYKYQNNKLLEEVKTVEGVEMYRETYTYDAKGNNIKKEYRKKDLIVITEYSYNEKNNVTSEKIYVNEVLDHYINYTYNEKHQKYKESKFSNANVEINTYTYFYTSAGQVQKIAFYDAGLGYEECSWTYTYNGDGSVDKIFTYSSKKDLKDTKQLPVYVTEHTYRYFPKPEKK